MKRGKEWLESDEKRSFDVLFSSAVSTLVTPLSVAAFAAVLMENHHVPLFWQERIGNPERKLKVPKLRTLSGPIEHKASQNGHNHIRAIGGLSKLVRKTHLDETPQFGLVLTGKMSVVGPRPIVKPEFEEIMDSLNSSEQAEWIMARKVCKPGLVNVLSPTQHIPGYENSLRDVVAADITYAQNASWDEDRRIILETTRSVIKDLFSVHANQLLASSNKATVPGDREAPA